MVAMRHSRRSWPVVLAAAVLVGCSATPTATPSAPPFVPPTASPSTAPSATPWPAPPLEVFHFEELATPASSSVSYGPVRALVNEFVVTGHDGPDTAVVWYGDATGTTWRLLDASGLGGDITDILRGPSGWLLAVKTPGQFGVKLWSSTDGRWWGHWAEPVELDNAFSADIALIAGTFVVTAELGGGVTKAYASMDGQTWAPVQLPVSPVGQVVPLADGFLAVSGGGLDGGPLTVQFSADGRSWTPARMTGASVPSTIDDAHAAGSGVIAIAPRTDAAPAAAWYGSLSGSGADVTIDWVDTTPVGGFGSHPITSTGLSDSSGIILGYDASTLAPITWSTTGPARWVRHDGTTAMFGSGMPDDLAVIGTTAITLGWEVNAAGESIMRPWRSVDGGSWSAVDTDAFGVLPDVPTGPCPPVALHEIGSYLAIPGVLLPVCFGHRTLRIRGYAVDCGGCGGVDPSIRYPEWLQHGLGIWPFYLQPGPPGEVPSVYRLGMAINPAHPVKVPPIGAYVEVAGHFDDPAAPTCTRLPIPELDAGFGPQALIVAACRQEFVVTSVTILAN